MYVMRTLLFITVGGIICIAAFMIAERSSNLYILASEGMALRAECILEDGAKNDLQEYFTLSCIESDADLTANTYDSYTVSSYDYSLRIEKVSVMPWAVTATVTAVERVTVKGSINADMLSEGESAADFPLPAWQSVRYKLHFVLNNTRWFISEMEVLETNPAAAPLNTPDPNRSPRPMATPTPAIADEAT